jgi:prevent-host-death family protein
MCRLTILVILTILVQEREFMESIPLTKAKARFSALVDRLIHRKDHIVITKHGKPVAALVPYEDWERRASDAAGGLASVVPPPENLDSDIDAMLEEIYEARVKSRSRKPAL